MALNLTTPITQGQSLLDVSVQELGSLAALFDAADAAGLAITDALTPGTVLPVAAGSGFAAPLVAGYFAQRQQRVNAGDTVPPAPAPTAARYFSPSFFSPSFFA